MMEKQTVVDRGTYEIMSNPIQSIIEKELSAVFEAGHEEGGEG